MPTVFQDGKFLEADQASISTANRAFRYADGCFEAVHIVDGSPVFWDLHFQRMSETIKVLQIDIDWNEEKLIRWIQKLIEVNNIEHGGMLRIMVFRQDGGKYFPISNQGQLFMEVLRSDENGYPPQPTLKRVMVYPEVSLPTHSLGNHKTLNKTIHVIAAVNAQRLGFDDAILLNATDELAEVVSSNLFLLIDGVLRTPPLSSGCLNGTTRKVLIRHQKELGIQLVECRLVEADLDEVTEIWTTNAGSGISVVEELNGRNYGSEKASEVQKRLIELASNSAQGFRESWTLH